MIPRFKRIAIKIGSNVLTRKDGTLDKERISSLTGQIAALHKAGIEIIMISSGAVASGKNEIKPQQKLDTVSARQLFSAVGQSKLINHYYKLFHNHKIVVGQVLTTKENFSSRRHYLNMKNCINVMVANRVIPIVNENDTISIAELMFTDNDELSGLIATMMDMEALIILSNIDGIYNGAPDNPASKVIREIGNCKQDLSSCIQSTKSSFGRGGMLTKCHIAQKVADEGIEVIIANGKKDNILIELLSEEHYSDTVCTRFLPQKKVSGIKKWIAHSEDFAKGHVYINDGARKALLGENATSLLPIGITRIEGTFVKDDIIRISDEQGTLIGIGKAAYDSKKAIEQIGKKGSKPLVHYDYLYLET